MNSIGMEWKSCAKQVLHENTQNYGSEFGIGNKLGRGQGLTYIFKACVQLIPFFPPVIINHIAFTNPRFV